MDSYIAMRQDHGDPERRAAYLILDSLCCVAWRPLDPNADLAEGIPSRAAVHVVVDCHSMVERLMGR